MAVDGGWLAGRWLNVDGGNWSSSCSWLVIYGWLASDGTWAQRVLKGGLNEGTDVVVQVLLASEVEARRSDGRGCNCG